jgi:hypothetical protein
MSLSSSAFNFGSLCEPVFGGSIRREGQRYGVKYSRASSMRQRMSADRSRVRHVENAQLPGERLPHEKCFHCGKTARVF